MEITTFDFQGLLSLKEEIKKRAARWLFEEQRSDSKTPCDRRLRYVQSRDEFKQR